MMTPDAGHAMDVRTHGRIEVTPWSSERPLFALAAIVSTLIWLIAAVSVVGILYAAVFGALLFVIHVVFITHVRGNGVRLGPDQFPELHARVEELAIRLGMERAPEAYLMQAGGALNAFATRLFRSNLLVLFSDLLEACGDNTAARDMIIGHELGHIRAGHLRWRWLLAPSGLIPFLGQALSRAREYTSDRYGVASAGDRDGALLGLTILAAGGTHGPQVNRTAMVRQRSNLETWWMTVGQLLSSHPPLAQRLVALDPGLDAHRIGTRRGTLRAAGIVAVVALPGLALAWWALSRLPGWLEKVSQQGGADTEYVAPPPEVATRRLEEGFRILSTFLAEELAASQVLPADSDELYTRWEAAHPGVEEPLDPYDGAWLGYEREGESYRLWSSGPDGRADTTDDIEFRPSPPAGRSS